MSVILSIETSGTTGSVALHQDGVCMATQITYKAYSHSATLGRSIEQVLASIGLQMQDLTHVALSDGPGSYTGLRIGASMAKGICFALGIPLIPVPTHLVMAQLGLPWVANGAYIIPLQDARRQEVYHTIYQLQGHSIIEVSPCTNHILSEASYAEYLQQQTPVYFVGDGASKWQELWLATNEQSALVYFLPNIKPLAEQVGQLAGVMLLAGYTAPNIVSYTPNYLKPWVGNQTVPKTSIRQFKAD